MFGIQARLAPSGVTGSGRTSAAFILVYTGNRLLGRVSVIQASSVIAILPDGAAGMGRRRQAPPEVEVAEKEPGAFCDVKQGARLAEGRRTAGSGPQPGALVTSHGLLCAGLVVETYNTQPLITVNDPS